MASIELLRGKTSSSTAQPMLEEFMRAAHRAGDYVTETTSYRGGSEWLALFGVGAEPHHLARQAQVSAGGRALLFDLGYFGREKAVGYLRVSIDHDHPQQWFDATPPSPARWGALGIELREDYDPDGPIILVGLGRKSRSYLREPDWEVVEYQRIRAKYPGRRIIYRPKPGHLSPDLVCERDETSPIEKLLKGASLAACRHSNVAVDAVVAGVPFEAQDGAATWLAGRDYTAANRLDFLHRLASWQWKATEAERMWKFAKEVVA